jgi:ribosome biogenesis GTPase
MKEHDKDYLRQQLEELSDVERRRLYKRAAKEKKKDDRERESGRASYKIPRNKKKDRHSEATKERSLDDWALRLLAQDLVEAEEKVYEGEGSRGTVAGTYSGWCDVLLHETGETVLCHLVGELARSQKTSLAVGDEVVAYPADDARWVVTSVLPRRTVLSRPDPHNPALERVIAANIELVCAVVSVKEPPLHPRILDRFWLAVERGGAQPLVAVNKIDLLEEGEREEVEEMLQPYREAGLRFYFVSATTGEGIDELREAMTGTVCTFLGHSGVGKSSLLNKVFPDIQAATGTVRPSDGRGRHTTTKATLYEGEGNTRLIDTPGVRVFGLWDFDDEALRDAFEEFDEFAPYCRFPDCTHTHEPGCAVQQAVEDGELSAFRYETYRRLIEDDPER